MKIYRSVDIEDEVRQALSPYATVYVRPLPANFPTPSTLIECVGGTSKDTIDTFSVKLSTRAKTDAEANEELRTVLGILEMQAKNQVGALRFSTENSLASWGSDPIRPDLKLCTATVIVVAHKESFTINES